MRYGDAAQILDRRNHAEVDRALVQQRRALRRRVEPQREELVAQLEPVDQRPRVQIVDRAEPDGSHPRAPIAELARTARFARPARRPPRGCCRESLRADCAACRAPRIDGRHAVDVVGADRQRDLRELRPVERPVHLDRRMFGSEQPRQRDGLHVVVAGRRRGDRQRRGSGAKARKPPTACAARHARARSATTDRSRPILHGQPQHQEPALPRRSNRLCRIVEQIERRPRRSPSSPASLQPRRQASSAIAASPRDRATRSRTAASYRPARASARTARHAASSEPGVPTMRNSPAADAGGSAAGSASTCASNTRTNVVSVPCSCRRTSSRDHADRNEIVAVEDQRGIVVAEHFALRHPLGERLQRSRGHARHPLRIFSHSASATLAACGVVAIFFGHGRVKPSHGHLRVASMPILLP